MIKNARASYGVALLILLGAVFLRMYNLPVLPPGLNDEEVIDIRWAENARQGDIQVFYDLMGEGREGLYPSVLAIVTSSIGGGTVGYRMLSVWAGLLMMVTVYATARRLYGDLAAIAAMSLLAFGFYPVLLSRQVGREILLALVVASILLTLSLALPVYWRRRGTTTQTSAFAGLGFLVGVSVYIHPEALVIPLFVLIYILYMNFISNRVNRQMLSYIFFASLLALIIAFPYIVSTVRFPELSGVSRLLTGVTGAEAPIFERMARGLLGFGIIGDANPAYNLPGRPLFDPVSVIIIVIGFIATVRNWRRPRYALPLVGIVLTLPFVLLAPDAPFFPSYAALLPILALHFGIGVNAILRRVSRRSLVSLLVAALMVANFVWTGQSLFVEWVRMPEVYAEYHGYVGQLARWLDTTADDTTTVICAKDITNETLTLQLSNGRLLRLMVNRQQDPSHYVDCSLGFAFPNAGEQTYQTLLLDVDNPLPPTVQAWIDQGQALQRPDIPPDSIIFMNLESQLADKIGIFTTTAPVTYAPEASAAGDAVTVAPPLPLENNLTFLGYEPLEKPTYAPGEVLTVTTYWRVDGELPSDLKIFIHVQDDPGAVPIANADVIAIVPDDYTNRDVFMQVVSIPLPEGMPAREYIVSAGAYRDESDERLGVLPPDGGTPRGNRFVLFRFNVNGDR